MCSKNPTENNLSSFPVKARILLQETDGNGAQNTQVKCNEIIKLYCESVTVLEYNSCPIA